jgi:hypothetical protein
LEALDQTRSGIGAGRRPDLTVAGDRQGAGAIDAPKVIRAQHGEPFERHISVRFRFSQQGALQICNGCPQSRSVGSFANEVFPPTR